MTRRLFVVFFVCLFACQQEPQPREFQGHWPAHIERVWIGPEYWANRLQDWRIADGRLECVFSGENRSVNLLTRELSTKPGDFSVRARVGLLSPESAEIKDAWVGFRLGVKGRFDDYRDSAVHGVGFNAGISTEGGLFLSENSVRHAEADLLDKLSGSGIELALEGTARENQYHLKLQALHPANGAVISEIERGRVPLDSLAGLFSLVSHFPTKDNAREKPSAWFSDWRITGENIEAHEDRTFGPILWAQYTLSKNVLKLTAQMPPLSVEDTQVVRLQIEQNGEWKTAAESDIDALARTAHFRLENWDGGQRKKYRLAYDLSVGENKTKTYFHEGVFRREPSDKNDFTIGALTCNNDLGFPQQELVANLKKHDPDILFFAGDQIYEGVGGYGVQRAPFEKAQLDYLRKWYLFGWAFGDILRDRPMIAITDDHDVYHGNIWGQSGKATGTDGTQSDMQDTGGYKMFPEWVRLVEKTQTSHLPDPHDPSPIDQGIGVYYCEVNYGGVSFAVLEDRKFKSAPKPLLPRAKIWNGWPQNPDFNPKTEADLPNAKLLGERQLDFLEKWTADWSNGTWMKVALSQTIFTNLATLPHDATSDQVVPGMKVYQLGEYAENDKMVSDFDSNGWPQTPRNDALKILRKGFAFHIAGDQHLGSTVQYGIENWNDAAYALCVPAISNIWPRRWFPPPSLGKNRKPGTPKYTGEFEDGFGNKITVHAIANPRQTDRKPARLYERVPGYGIVRLNKETRNITFENWPSWVDPSGPNARPYADWPVVFNQNDNFPHTRDANYLPGFKVSGIKNPVLQVIDETNGEIVQTLRISGDYFKPRVLKDGKYTIRIGEPGTEKMQEFRSVSTRPDYAKSVRLVEFE